MEFLLVFGGPFSLRNLLLESSSTQAKHVRPADDFASKTSSYKRITKVVDGCWSLIGYKIMFGTQSQLSIRVIRGTGSLRVAFQGLSRLFLKTFGAIIPGPTDRPSVPEDG